jgi:hypothetical protein
LRISFVVLLLTLTSCSAKQATPEPRVVEVVGTDYAFQVPESLPAGPTLFRFVNRGKVRHELNLFMLKRGVTIQQYLERRKQNKPAQDLIDGPVGVLFAEAADQSDAGLSTDLVAGREYVAICIFKDQPAGPPHYAMGMYSLIRVQGPAVAQQPAARTDQVVGLDYAFTHPATLSPGHHSLAFENRGKVRHEMVLMLLRKGITTDSLLVVGRRNGDTDPLIEDAPGLLTAPAGQKSLGRLDVDLLPGREYTLICFFSDSTNAPPHVALGMYGRIRVTGSLGN